MAHPSAFWDLAASATNEADLSGHGRDGTYVGRWPRRATLADGEFAADFDQPGERLRVPSNPSSSIGIWVDGVRWNRSYHAPTGCMSQYSVTPKALRSPRDIGTMARDSWFAGAAGKVAIYDYLLIQTQINAHYRAMTGERPSGSCRYVCTASVPRATGVLAEAETNDHNRHVGTRRATPQPRHVDWEAPCAESSL